jgi:DNA-binding NarL/FixJ family response regulator
MEPANMSIKILLAEDHEIVRKGIKALFENSNDFNIVGEASNGKEALEKTIELHPDVILMDMTMPVMNGLECTRIIKERFNTIKILILSMHDEEQYLIEMLDAGADGYVLKSNSRDELAFAIKKIVNGGAYVSPEFTINMLAKYKAASGFSATSKINVTLSPREMDVLYLIAEGLTNIEIANKLFTSRRTVETHRKRLLEKTHTTNTATMIKFAVQHGLVK